MLGIELGKELTALQMLSLGRRMEQKYTWWVKQLRSSGFLLASVGSENISYLPMALMVAYRGVVTEMVLSGIFT